MEDGAWKMVCGRWCVEDGAGDRGLGDRHQGSVAILPVIGLQELLHGLEAWWQEDLVGGVGGLIPCMTGGGIMEATTNPNRLVCGQHSGLGWGGGTFPPMCEARDPIASCKQGVQSHPTGRGPITSYRGGASHPVRAYTRHTPHFHPPPP